MADAIGSSARERTGATETFHTSAYRTVVGMGFGLAVFGVYCVVAARGRFDVAASVGSLAVAGLLVALFRPRTATVSRDLVVIKSILRTRTVPIHDIASVEVVYAGRAGFVVDISLRGGKKPRLPNLDEGPEWLCTKIRSLADAATSTHASHSPYPPS